MTPATIIQKAMADRVTLALSPAGTIKAQGNGEAVNRWLPVIREHKAELLAVLRAGNDGDAELRHLVRTAGTFYGFSDAEHVLALEIALSDPVEALTCFRILTDCMAKVAAHSEQTRSAHC